MHHQHFLIFCIYFFGKAITISQAENLRCPLQWEPYQAGNEIPSKAVKGRDGELVGKPTGLWNGLGIVNPQNLHLFMASNSEKHAEFEILTNPLECNISWVSMNDPKITTFKMGITLEGNFYVGKPESYQDSTFGIINKGRNEITYFMGSSTVKSRSFTALISFSEGISTKIDNFVFKNNSVPISLSVVGMDEISNLADTTVSQEVTHSSTVTESFRISSYQEKSVYYGGHVQANIGMPKYGFGASAKYEERTTRTSYFREDYSKSYTKQIISTREVTVSFFKRKYA